MHPCMWDQPTLSPTHDRPFQAHKFHCTIRPCFWLWEEVDVFALAPHLLGRSTYSTKSSHFKPLHHPEHLCDDVNKLTRLSDFFTNDVKVQIIANGLNCVAFEPNGHYTSVKVKILATGFYNLVVPWRAMLQSWGWDAQIHMLGSGSGWALQLLQCWLGWCWCSCTPSIYVMRYIAVESIWINGVLRWISLAIARLMFSVNLMAFNAKGYDIELLPLYWIVLFWLFLIKEHFLIIDFKSS